MYYVYQYIDPVTNLPLYIGKGKNNRIYDHWISVCSGENATNKHWTYKLKEMLRNNIKPSIEKISENLTSSQALDLEESLIKKYGRRDYEEGGILYNHLLRANDWTGAKHSKDSKIKIGLAHRGKKLSQQHIDTLKQANTGLVRSKDTLEKMSRSQKGKPKSELTKYRMSLTAKNNPRSQSQIDVFALAREKAHSKEARQKQANTMKGKKHSEETIRKMQESARKRWELKRTTSS